MKYGESLFDIAYLVIAIVSGIYILTRRKDKIGKLMGFAVLILGIGDAFHLVPRVLNYFIEYDFTMYLGIGKLVTSITMTVFYLLMYMLYKACYGKKYKKLDCLVILLVLARIILCALPQNEWVANTSSILWGVIRNVPFVILGAVVVVLYFKNRNEIKELKNVWIYVTLSFLFYIPVAVLASVVPMLGMLMLPKTICYILMIFAFRKYARAR